MQKHPDYCVLADASTLRPLDKMARAVWLVLHDVWLPNRRGEYEEGKKGN